MVRDPLKCCGELMWGMEYYYTSPNRYDGVSEWQCKKCGKRIGRWSGKVLRDGEEEVRLGGRK